MRYDAIFNPLLKIESKRKLRKGKKIKDAYGPNPLHESLDKLLFIFLSIGKLAGLCISDDNVRSRVWRNAIQQREMKYYQKYKRD